MPFIEPAILKIREILLRSPIPEDPSHAQNTLDWLMFLWPDSDLALQVAALGHDIERAYPEHRVAKTDYQDYDSYKKAHADHSARILAKVLIDCDCPREFVNQVIWLVERHESGGDAMSDRLNQADSISFFDNNLPYFFTRNGRRETLARARWGIQRLSPELIPLVASISYSDDMLNQILAEVIRAI